MRIRRPKGERKTTCSKCGGEREASRAKQRYCKSCHAENMRASRAKNRAFQEIMDIISNGSYKKIKKWYINTKL